MVIQRDLTADRRQELILKYEDCDNWGHQESMNYLMTRWPDVKELNQIHRNFNDFDYFHVSTKKNKGIEYVLTLFLTKWLLDGCHKQ